MRLHRIHVLALSALVATPLAARLAPPRQSCDSFSDSELVASSNEAIFALPPVEGPDGDLWLPYTEVTGDLFMLVRDAASGAWTKTLIASNAGFVPPDIAVDSNGVVIVIWSQAGELFEARFTPGLGWSTPGSFANTGLNINSHDLGTDADDNVIVTYRTGLAPAVNAIVWDADTESWGPIQPLSDPTSAGFVGEKVATNEAGDAVHLVYSSRITPDALEGIWVHAWDPASLTFGPGAIVPGTEEVRPFFDVPIAESRVVTDAAGEMTIVWQDTLFDVYTSQTSNGVWQAPIFHVDFSVPTSTSVEVSATDVTPDGKVVIALVRSLGFSGYEFWVLDYDPATGWSPAQLLETVGGDFPDPRAMFYAGDRAVAVLSSELGLFAYHFNGAEWGTEALEVPDDVFTDLAAIGTSDGDFWIVARDALETGIRAMKFGDCGFVDLGGPLNGSQGHPRLTANSDQVPGETVVYKLEKALENSLAVWAMGTTAAYIPFAFGHIIPSPDIQIPFVTDANGEIEIAATWPVGIPSGFRLYYQFWIPDPFPLSGFAASNALCGTTP